MYLDRLLVSWSYRDIIVRSVILVPIATAVHHKRQTNEVVLPKVDCDTLQHHPI